MLPHQPSGSHLAMLMLLSSSTSSALMPALTPRLRQPAHASPTVRMQFDFFGGGGGKKKTAAKSKSPLDFFGGGDGKKPAKESKYTIFPATDTGNFYDYFDLPGKLLDSIKLPALPGFVQTLAALSLVAAPVGVLSLFIAVLVLGTPGTQTPFNFLDQFYPPAIETKRVDEQKVAALKAKVEAEKAEAEAKAKAAADAEAKAKADAAEGAAV